VDWAAMTMTAMMTMTMALRRIFPAPRLFKKP
jgi:hypothetical protein